VAEEEERPEKQEENAVEDPVQEEDAAKPM